MDIQKTTSTITSKDQELVKENAKFKAKIATLRRQLQDKDFAQGQMEGNTFSPRKEATQVQGQRKEQTKQPQEFEEPPSFQDMLTSQDTIDPQEDTQVDIEPNRLDFKNKRICTQRRC